jgi:hypothetical protein
MLRPRAKPRPRTIVVLDVGGDVSPGEVLSVADGVSEAGVDGVGVEQV